MVATIASRDTPDEHTPQGNPAKTILIFSVALAPLAILPYVLVRRHVLSLRQEIAELRQVSGGATKEMRMARQEAAQHRAATSQKAFELLEGNRALLADIKSNMKAIRKAAEDNGREAIESRLSEVTAMVKEMDREAGTRASDLKNMISVIVTVAKERETKARRWRNSTAVAVEMLLEGKQRRKHNVAALGMSLADIASFIQEVEIRQGWTPRLDDGRGIERMRELAKQLLDQSSNTKLDLASTTKQGTSTEDPEPAPESATRPEA